MKKRILLVAINAKYIHSNLAVYSLKANAGAYAEQVEMAEYTINHRKEEILKGIYKHHAQVVAFSCYIWNISYVLSVAEDLKKIQPEVTIVLGGPEVSYDAPKILEEYPFLDLIMVGEGEQTFRKYAQHVCEGHLEEELWQLPGLCLRQKSGGIVSTGAVEPLPMDELVFPYGDMREMENRIIYYETIRGCPFSCSYCLSSIEKCVRFRSLELVFAELDFFLANGVPQVKFVDRTFNCDRERAYKIWKYIHEHDNGVTNFHFEIGGDLLRAEDFQLFAKFRPGLVQFEIGVQSTNEQTLEAIRRKMDIKELAANVEAVRRNKNIHQHLDLIAGLPYEGFSSFRRSFNEVYGMKPDQFQLGFLKVLKGAHMEEETENYGLRYTSTPPYEVLATKWLSYEEVLWLKQVEEMVEVYYNSFQFQSTMALLFLCEKEAFAIYENLGRYYEDHGLYDVKHSRMARYEILWTYVCQRFPEKKEMFRQTLTYDLYLRDYVKNPPAFVPPREKAYTTFVRSFLEGEVENPKYLSGYQGLLAKQLFHMVYVQEFTLEFEKLLEQGTIETVPPRSLLFDYRHRNPLNHSAAVRCISSKD